MNRLPPLKALHAFRCAGEVLSFKEAAAQLHVTPTAISQQIKLLEGALGVPLFKRHVRKVELTAEGRQLLPYLSDGFNKLEMGIRALSSDRDPSILTMSALPSFSARFLIPRLSQFQEASGLKIQLQPSLDLVSFEGSGLDVAVRFGEGRYDGLESKHLLDDYILPVCHASLIQPDKSVVATLNALPMFSDNSKDFLGVEQSFLESIGIAGAESRTVFQVTDANLLLEAVLSAQGFSCVRYSLVHELLERGILCCPIPKYRLSPYRYYLVAPEAHFKWDKIRWFEQWLRQEMQSIEMNWAKFSQSLSSIEVDV